MTGRQQAGAVPYPVHAFRFAEGVQVDKHLPLWLVAGERLKRGSSPQAADVFRVSPMVVEEVAALIQVRDLLLGVQNLQNACLQRLEVRRLELIGGVGV